MKNSNTNTLHRTADKLSVRLLTAMLVGLLLSACAGTSDATRDPRDPWEGFNRGSYELNKTLDDVIIRPLAKGYHYVTPDLLEQGISNFVSNLSYPVTIVNLLLQGKFEDFGESLGRFVLNSTFGLAGLLDPASIEGIPVHNEDFGQTFATWGWEDSPYLMIPFLGPATLRDGVGRIPAFYVDGVNLAGSELDRYEPLAGQILSGRVDRFGIDEELEAAADPYLLIRDAYLQSRDFEINDGETELPDYDLYLDDLESIDGDDQ